MILFWGAFLGLISVIFGAYADHGLQPALTPELLRSLETAIRYNQIGAVMISMIGLAVNSRKLYNMTSLRWSAALFIIGTLCFSISIYLSIAFSWHSIIYLAPIGGVCLIFAWLLLTISGLTMKKSLNDHKNVTFF